MNPSASFKGLRRFCRFLTHRYHTVFKVYTYLYSTIFSLRDKNKYRKPQISSGSVKYYINSEILISEHKIVLFEFISKNSEKFLSPLNPRNNC